MAGECEVLIQYDERPRAEIHAEIFTGRSPSGIAPDGRKGPQPPCDK